MPLKQEIFDRVTEEREQVVENLEQKVNHVSL